MIRNEPLFTGTPAARKNSGHRTVIRVDSQGKKSKEETRYALTFENSFSYIIHLKLIYFEKSIIHNFQNFIFSAL